MVWDQVYLNTQEFIESVENLPYEEVLDKIKDFERPIYLFFDNIKTELPISEQLDLLKDTYKHITLFTGPKGPVGILFVNEEDEFFKLYNLYVAVLQESLYFTKH